MKIRGTDFVLYPVSNLAAAVAFYRDVLGLRADMYSEEYHWAEFDCGDVTLALHGVDKPVKDGSGTQLALAVEDLDGALRELKAKGVPAVSPIQDFGVCRAFEVRDPDGHSILLHHRADGSFGNTPAPASAP